MRFTANKNPVTEGRYIVLSSDPASMGYVRPLVIAWYKDRWYYPESSLTFSRPVHGWCGPIPVGLVTELFPDAPTPDYSKAPEVTHGTHATITIHELVRVVDADAITQEYDL